MRVVLVTLFGIGVTAAAYLLALTARKRFPSPLTTPVFFSTAIVIAVLFAAHVTFREYGPAKEILTFLLGPATVALAVPLYRNRGIFREHVVPTLCAVTAGSIGTSTIAGIAGTIWALPPALIASLCLKSVTAPVAIELAKIVHGDPALAAMFVVCTGMLGASLGPWFMDRANVHDPLSRGIALGTISHGQGTAQAASESELSGAVAGIAMGLSAVILSTAAPFIVTFSTQRPHIYASLSRSHRPFLALIVARWGPRLGPLPANAAQTERPIRIGVGGVIPIFDPLELKLAQDAALARFRPRTALRPRRRGQSPAAHRARDTIAHERRHLRRGKTIVYHVRDHVRFGDGRPVRGSDVVDTVMATKRAGRGVAVPR